MKGVVGQGKGRDIGCRHGVRVHCSSSKRGSGGEVRLQPSHYGLESKRAKSSPPLAKGIALPHCPLSQQLGRGGWEPLNYMMTETATAGRGGTALRYRLHPLPDTRRQSLIKSKNSGKRRWVALRAGKTSLHHGEASWSEQTPPSQWGHGIFLN